MADSIMDSRIVNSLSSATRDVIMKLAESDAERRTVALGSGLETSGGVSLAAQLGGDLRGVLLLELELSLTLALCTRLTEQGGILEDPKFQAKSLLPLAMSDLLHQINARLSHRLGRLGLHGTIKQAYLLGGEAQRVLKPGNRVLRIEFDTLFGLFRVNIFIAAVAKPVVEPAEPQSA